MLDVALGVSGAFELLPIDVELVWLVRNGFVVHHQTHPEENGDPLLLEAVTLLGRAGLRFDSLVRNEDEISGMKLVVALPLVSQCPVLRVIPDGLPEQSVPGAACVSFLLNTCQRAYLPLLKAPPLPGGVTPFSLFLFLSGHGVTQRNPGFACLLTASKRTCHWVWQNLF